MTDQRPSLEDFIKEYHDGKVLLRADDDLFEKLKLGGDDCDEFLEAFSQKFNVDMSDFLWYFHHEEEASNLGATFFKPPNQRVVRIPITLNLLSEAIVTHRWPVHYPPHTLPKRRWDMIINTILFGSVFALALIALLFKIVKWALDMHVGAAQ
jgi:hypothetical protein